MIIGQNESLLRTIASVSRNIEVKQHTTVEPASLRNVIFKDFSVTEGVPLSPSYTSIGKYIETQEKDNARRIALENARREIAERFYSKTPASIATLRLKKGWSQKRLADEIGTSQPHIARIEAGREDIRLSTIKKLAVAFDIPASEFITIFENQS